MDKDQLKQIRFIKSEIDVIESQIAGIEPVLVKDKVSGSSAYFPYIERGFTLEGTDVEDYCRRTRRLQNKLTRRKKELLELQEEANSFIENIDDSLIRQAITLRYLQGLSWADVAMKIGNDTTADSLRMAVKRFMEI